ncbi:alpha/beta-hydrolase [Trichoderma citrinoviride]|uniref:Alpha/beta-hydrolase n=1 Tax=Trichoderma citrinoviride TaxID=58853 RepID=A0A2T4B2Y8_9HYPO|nr:alpha/beta-hydrolase [Trichoderma citrinoviride]PTB63670.1 alpha/beta-hydrolase [Trichoderma citrinoviride]
MHFHQLLPLLAAAAQALPQSTSSLAKCRDVQIPITVSTPRFIVTASIQDDWDVAALTLNLTRRDSTMSADPLPLAGQTSESVKSTYTVGATLCGNGGPTLVLTHGIIESKLYWNPSFPGSSTYNFIEAALAQGYSVLSYDRIGVGSSAKVNSLTDAQFQVEVAVLEGLVNYAKTKAKATKVALIGHSYGSYISSGAASHISVDGLVLTGFSGTFQYFAPFVAGAGLRVAKTQNPLRWGHLDSGYLTTSDLYAETYVYYAEPYFEHSVAEYTYTIGSEPFAVGELPSVLATTINYQDIKAPTLVLQGQFDVSACGGNCVGVVNGTKALFTGAKTLEYVDNLPAGHNLNFHKVAPQAFQKIFTFLKAQGVKP